MFIPLHDANSLDHIRLQYVTLSLIALNVFAYVITVAGGDTFFEASVLGLGYIPAVMHDYADLAPSMVVVPEQATYITYAFLHGDIMHLGGNMLFLWVFGDNIEDALGHVKFLVFYLACAVAGAWLHGFLAPESDAPLIGASGAVAGIIAAYVILHPSVRVWVLAFGRIPLRLPAWIPLLGWVGLQFAMLVAMPEDMVSWAAHAGGIVAGALLVLVLRRRGVPLFDRAIVTPRGAIVAGEEDASIPPPASRPVQTRRWGRQR